MLAERATAVSKEAVKSPTIAGETMAGAKLKPPFGAERCKRRQLFKAPREVLMVSQSV